MSGIIAGYALVWSDEAMIDGKRERFAPFVFREPIVACLRISHDDRPGAILASTARALKVEQDDHGVRFSAQLGDDRDARRVLQSVRGGLCGCSFGFKPIEQRGDEDEVLVVKATLSEISLTNNGAYQGGGVWAADAEWLPPHLEALRARWHASTTANRPARIDRELAAFAASKRWAASLARPVPQGAGADLVSQVAKQHIVKYIGSR